MLTLVNTNRMLPPIAPIALDYIAGHIRREGLEVEILDLNMAGDPRAALSDYFAKAQPELVGLSFRNSDDCFWPSAQWFAPGLAETVRTIRTLTDAPVVLGGVGFSIFAEPIMAMSGADFGIHGDGEEALVALIRELRNGRRFDRVPGLIWREAGQGESRLADGGAAQPSFHRNPPAWPRELVLPTSRSEVDNRYYYENGGQLGFETKRGCDRGCAYCADPLAKGRFGRLRRPAEVADELQTLAVQGFDVLHTCDCEFNVPGEHAEAVCDELIGRGLGERVRWYAYLAVVPFGPALAAKMARAGCVGINFTVDSVNDAMLARYRQPHRREDIIRAVALCREHGIRCMFDLLLGGPDETPETAAETINLIQRIGPDCAGASLGVRLYPGTPIAQRVLAEAAPETNPGIRRKYEGPIDLFQPTFYISPQLGPQPAQLVRDLIAGDQRFFEPALEANETGHDHNYNDNRELTDAIRNGARGAYWDILRQLRSV